MKKTVLALLAVILLAACQPQTAVTGEVVSVEGGSYKNVSANELNSMLKDKDFVIVNVHISFAGNIPNTDLSIP